MKTIRELAGELGVSKTAVRKHMDEHFRAEHTENMPGNIIGIDEDGCKLIAESIRKPPETTANQFAETAGNQVFADEVSFLREQLRVKDQQIERLQDQLDKKEDEIINLTAAINNMSCTVQGEQALHAGTMKKQFAAGEPERDEVAVTVEPVDQQNVPVPADLDPAVCVPPTARSFWRRCKAAWEVLKGD